MSEIHGTVEAPTIRQLIADYLNDKFPNVGFKADNLDLKVRSKQNYRNKEWESGAMKITIHNLRDEQPQYPYDFEVDRSTPLGNPFWMRQESQRRYACEQYSTRTFPMWIREGRSKQIRRLEEMLAALRKYGKLRLFCWCAPKQCHAETIREYLNGQLSKIQRKV